MSEFSNDLSLDLVNEKWLAKGEILGNTSIYTFTIMLVVQGTFNISTWGFLYKITA